MSTGGGVEKLGEVVVERDGEGGGEVGDGGLWVVEERGLERGAGGDMLAVDALDVGRVVDGADEERLFATGLCELLELSGSAGCQGREGPFGGGAVSHPAKHERVEKVLLGILRPLPDRVPDREQILESHRPRLGCPPVRPPHRPLDRPHRTPHLVCRNNSASCARNTAHTCRRWPP